MRQMTTLALPKSERETLELLARVYGEEKQLLRPISLVDTLVFAIRECLLRRGIDFLPAPEGAKLVPVIRGREETVATGTIKIDVSGTSKPT